MTEKHSKSFIKRLATEYATNGKAWSDFCKTLPKEEQALFLKTLAKETVRINKEHK